MEQFGSGGAAAVSDPNVVDQKDAPRSAFSGSGPLNPLNQMIKSDNSSSSSDRDEVLGQLRRRLSSAEAIASAAVKALLLKSPSKLSSGTNLSQSSVQGTSVALPCCSNCCCSCCCCCCSTDLSTFRKVVKCHFSCGVCFSVSRRRRNHRS